MGIPRVTVVIVNFNGGEHLLRCLAGLAAQTVPPRAIVLIDNASSDRSLAGAHAAVTADPRLAERTTIESLPDNLGFAAAANRGLAQADTAFVALLNPDAVPAPDWLEKLLESVGRHPQVAAFGSRQMRCGDTNVLDGVGDSYHVSGLVWRAGHGRALRPADLVPREIFSPCAAAALYRRDALRKIGGFDERFFCFYEDIDVAFRFRLAGLDCAVVPAAIVEHVGGASFEGLSDISSFLIARNQWWVLVKNMPFTLLCFALPGFAVLQLFGLLRHPASARMKGLAAGLARTGEFLKARRQVRGLRAPTANVGRWISWNPISFLRKTSPVRS